MAVQQKKKKKWYSIYATGLFKDQKIGESLSNEAASLVGKKIALNLMELTNDPKKQNFRIIFKVVKVENDKAAADLICYEMLITNVKRIMRKGVEKIEESLIVQSKDNINVQLKPMLLTRRKIKRSIASAIRKKLRETLLEEAKKLEYNELIQYIIFNKIQKQVKDAMNKIYPLVVVEFRIVKKL